VKAVERREIDESEEISLCSLYVGDDVFGIETKKVCEVLGECEVQRVPRAPAYIAGVVSYRGEVLTTVNFRSVVGLEEGGGGSYVLVLEDDESAERFGLRVDAVGSVVTVNASVLEGNPSTLDARSRALFDGVYRMENGLMVRLDPQRLRPSGLKAICGVSTRSEWRQECEH
jgi:purine-binding chemotaxis protein CheW